MELQKNFAPYKIAKQLKDKGFNAPCFGFYVLNHKEVIISELRDELSGIILAPIYQQITEWLREEHNIIIEIQLDQTSNIKFCIEIIKFNKFADFQKIDIPIESWKLFRNYYEALNQSIQESLKLISDIK